MKGILSTILAVVMVTLMNVTVFAGNKDNAVEDVYPIPFAYDTEKNHNMTFIEEAYIEGIVPYGEMVYYAFQSNGRGEVSLKTDNVLYKGVAEKFVHETDAVQSVAIRQSWEMGKEFIENITIVKKKVDAVGQESLNGMTYTNTEGEEERYFYFLVIEITETMGEDREDIVGTITLKKSSGGDSWVFPEEKDHEIEVSINLEIGYEAVEEPEIQSTYALYTFNADPEEYVTFTASTDSYFVVDTCDQDSMVGKFDTDYNQEIAQKYPEANLDFFNGSGLTFNKLGEMHLSAKEEGYLYEVVEGELFPVYAVYDADEQAYRFFTRTIGAYVTSDSPLIEEKPAENVFTITTVKKNPPTGSVA